MKDEPEAFEEYWIRTAGTGGLDNVPATLVKIIASTCYTAGQTSALKWYTNKMKSTNNG